MKDNQIIFNIKDNHVRISLKDKSLTLPDLIQLTCTGVLTAMNNVVKSAPPEIQTKVKEELYDMYNAAASSLLNFFAPEIELRPNLTAQAILEKENEIIESEYRKTILDPNYVSPIAEKPKLQIVK